MNGPVEDRAVSWPVVSTDELLRNWLITVRTDKVRLPDGHHAERTVVTHPGAVAVLALDDADRVLMIRQYRHPVGRELWEIPAGLRDADGESPLRTAQRELLEETGYRAREWHTLADYFSSPGYTTERIRVFLARGSSPSPITATSARMRRSSSSPTGCRWMRHCDSRWRENSTAGQLLPAFLLGMLPAQRVFLGFAPRPRPKRSAEPAGAISGSGNS